MQKMVYTSRSQKLISTTKFENIAITLASIAKAQVVGLTMDRTPLLSCCLCTQTGILV